MKKTFEFTEQEAELLRKEQYKYLINDNIDHFLLLVQQIISERITPGQWVSGQSAEDMLKGMYGNNTQYGYSFNSTIEAMRLHASQVCADKEREIEELKASTWISIYDRLPTKEGIYDVKKRYSDDTDKGEWTGSCFTNYDGYAVTHWKENNPYINQLKSEISAANESLTVMMKKNTELEAQIDQFTNPLRIK